MDGEEKPMPAVKLKKLDMTKYSGLTQKKKALLKEYMGSVPTKVDMNKVRDWWKYENR
ncbi:hypothetical protein B0G52_112160 [Cohnella sp. SGD-V74]|jgi:hypothetical protein|uniref:hypothetical protein n=1 Tax=unclassified Cohnella TaxID=2636738 RepID=UPI000D46B833|nr:MULTISPECIES: hypothetical protein [unclassified Cohnella]PRX69801.1 hypothetical protein B0G52_112160 [Cohnella sp. SGD-V74]